MNYLITKGEADPSNFEEKKSEILEIIRIAAECGIDYLQIREKKLSARLLFSLTKDAAAITRNSKTKLLVNDRLDIALAAGADGLHLTSTSLPTRKIREIAPKDFIIGVSCHSMEKAREARDAGADFITFSPIYSKDAKGIAPLKAICEELAPFPVFALGGIDESNFKEALNYASGIAAIRFLNKPDNLRMLAGITS